MNPIPSVTLGRFGKGGKSLHEPEAQRVSSGLSWLHPGWNEPKIQGFVDAIQSRKRSLWWIDQREADELQGVAYCSFDPDCPPSLIPICCGVVQPSDKFATELRSMLSEFARQGWGPGGAVFLDSLVGRRTRTWLSNFGFTQFLILQQMCRWIEPASKIWNSNPNEAGRWIELKDELEFRKLLRAIDQGSQDCRGSSEFLSRHGTHATHAIAAAIQADFQVQLLSKPDTEIWVYREKKATTPGACAVTHMRANQLEIAYFGLHPSYRGRHRSARFLEQLMVHVGNATEMSRMIVHLSVDSANLPAMRAYQRAGFQPVSSQECWVTLLDADEGLLPQGAASSVN